jgi:hypothetical protein
MFSTLIRSSDFEPYKSSVLDWSWNIHLYLQVNRNKSKANKPSWNQAPQGGYAAYVKPRFSSYLGIIKPVLKMSFCVTRPPHELVVLHKSVPKYWWEAALFPALDPFSLVESTGRPSCPQSGHSNKLKLTRAGQARPKFKVPWRKKGRKRRKKR